MAVINKANLDILAMYKDALIRLFQKEENVLKSLSEIRFVLESIFDCFVPNDEYGNPIAKRKFEEFDGFFNKNGMELNVLNNTLCGNILSLHCFLDKYMKYLTKKFFIVDKDILISYLYILVVIHELEHIQQLLVKEKGSEILPATLVELYEIFYKMNKDGSFDTKILEKYESKKRFYVIERNANVESYKTISALAYYCGDNDIANVFDKLKYYAQYLGYNWSNEGSISKTMRDLNISCISKLPDAADFSDFTIDEKIRYGMPIPKQEAKYIRSRIREFS